MSAHLSEQEIVRREALEKLRQAGIDPYPAAEFPVTHHTRDIRENFDPNSKAPKWYWPDE